MKAILRVPLIIVTFTTAADSVTSIEFPAEKGDAVSTDLVQPTAWEAKSKISAVLEREAAVFEDVEGLTDSVVEGRQLSDVCEDSTTWYQESRGPNLRVGPPESRERCGSIAANAACPVTCDTCPRLDASAGDTGSRQRRAASAQHRGARFEYRAFPTDAALRARLAE
ncbi:hypothetical protein JL720_11886 [Aureococcus anophagefferens]|nr:hypothetical protein JL720_11886 [Aureococcus anophagefferens]